MSGEPCRESVRLKIRIVVIGYRRVVERFKKISLPQDLKTAVDLNLEYHEALLDKAVAIARRIEGEEGVDVFVTGSSNARLLRQCVSSPVVTIAVSTFDIVRAVREAAATAGGVIALASCEQPSRELDEVVDLLGVPVVEIVYEEATELRARLVELQARSCRAVVGTGLACEIAEGCGLTPVLVYSDESIRLTLRTAVEAAVTRKREMAKAEELQAILNFAFGGILAADKQGYITVFNPSAERILGMPARQLLGRKAPEDIRSALLGEVLATGHPQFNQVERVGDATIVVNRVPLVVRGEVTGVVATFQESSTLQFAVGEVRRSQRKKGFVARATFSDIVHKSSCMERAVALAERFAASDLTVLITGESGVGKELFAQGIHNASPRRDGPFVAVNCAALPENLLESELFGYEDGAFTGARRGGKEGLFEIAHRGTIFLDEVGELSAGLQARLLRVLQEREILRVGGTRLVPVDARVVASTNRDLEAEVQRGRFRQDLFYRLSVLRLRIPPLRQRPEDIPLLVAEFIKKKTPPAHPSLLDPLRLNAIVSLLERHTWPGNVRELENFVDSLLVLLGGRAPSPVELARTTRQLAEEIGITVGRAGGGSSAPRGEALSGQDSSPECAGGAGSGGKTWFRLPVTEEMEEYLRDKIRRALDTCGGNRALAASMLGVSRATLWRKMKKLGLC